MRDTSKASYEWVTLRETNVAYVASMTGRSKRELRELLERHKNLGFYEVKLPLDTTVFTREEK